MTKPALTTTVISDLAWEQLTNMDAPANSPIASTVAGVAPVQSWEETDQVLPDIGQVDNELLAAAGLSNTILISVKTEEVLKTITVSIGDNGNWFVGGVDTGVAAQGTNEASIARPTGVYGAASVFHVGNTLTIGTGLMYCVKEGQNFFTMQTTAELNISVDASTTFVTIDRTGTVRTYSSGINLWTIPESQALVALVIDTDGVVNSFAVPTVHNAMLMASAVIPYSQGAIKAASTASLQATIASQFAWQARQSALEAEAAKLVTQADAGITTTNAQLTEQWKNDAQAAATSAHEFADFADADRVATAADRAQVATDKAAVAADRSTVATDKSIVASDKAITLGYKNGAAASKNLAAEYAIKPEGSIITGTVSDYSALHWAQKAQQWAQAVSSALVWKGQWNAPGNTAPPTPAVGTGAHFYRISGAGTINSVAYEVGDYIHWDTVNLSWFKIDGTDAVMTVNGKAPIGGNVALSYTDVGAVPQARTINSKPLTSNITLSAADVGALGVTATAAKANLLGNTNLNTTWTAYIAPPSLNWWGDCGIGHSQMVRSGNGFTGAGYVFKIGARDMGNGHAWIGMTNYGDGGNLIFGANASGSAAPVWATVYSTRNKPTAADVGALPATGGTVSGALGVTAELDLVGGSASDMADIVWIAPDGTERGRLWIGGTIGADNSLTWRSGASGAVHKIYHEGNKPTAADVGAAPAGFGLGGYGTGIGSVLGDTSLRRQSGFFQGPSIEGLPTSPHPWNYVFNQAHANADGFFGYLAISFDCSKAWIGGQNAGGQRGPFELVKQGDRFVAMNAGGNDFNQCAVEVNGNTAIDSRPGIGFHMPGRFASTLHLWEGGDFRFHTQGVNSYAGIMTGNVSANDVYIRSDRRLKKNFVEVRDALRKVSALTAYSYDKKQTLEATEYDKKEVGLIAQDVEQVLPEAVTRVVDSSNKDGTEILTLSNSALIALLVGAVKELSEKVKELEHGRT